MYSTKVKILNQTRPTQSDLSFDEACMAFFNWKDAVAESAEEYSERIRKIKLLNTFKSVLKNELTNEQRTMLKMKYLENKNGEEIAAAFGVSRSTVCRNLMRITEVFNVRMKYVFEYADMDIRNEVMPAFIEQAVAVMSVESGKTDCVGKRLEKARDEKLLPISLVAEMTGVAKNRIENLEQNGNISLNDFIKLISFYKVSADQVIFGV